MILARWRRRAPKPMLRFDFPDGEMGEALVLGDVTDRSVRVWARAPRTLQLRLLVEDEVVARAELEPDPAHDDVGAVVLQADRPRPGARFRVEGGVTPRTGVFAPAPGSPASFAFAFGSCHQPFEDDVVDGRVHKHRDARIYPPIRRLLEEHEARFLLLLGDQVYSDGVSNLSVREVLAEDERVSDADLVETYRHLHRGYFNEQGFRALTEAFPTYMMWDDHDIYDGAGSLLHPTAFDDRLRSAATVAFREYQHLRNPGAVIDAPPPTSFNFWYGDVGFHVLDLRSCREWGAGQILGTEGWRRLDAFLEEASARGVPTVFIGASVPVVHGSPRIMRAFERWPLGSGKDIRDRWSVPKFEHEETALLDRLFAWQTGAPRRQVVILSGDVHVGAAFVFGRKGAAGQLHQWTSSALSTPSGIEHVVANRVLTSLVGWGEKALVVRRRGLVTENNIGLVQVEAAAGGGHDVTFRGFGFDAGQGALRPAFTVRARPGRSS